MSLSKSEDALGGVFDHPGSNSVVLFFWMRLGIRNWISGYFVLVTLVFTVCCLCVCHHRGHTLFIPYLPTHSGTLVGPQHNWEKVLLGLSPMFLRKAKCGEIWAFLRGLAGGDTPRPPYTPPFILLFCYILSSSRSVSRERYFFFAPRFGPLKKIAAQPCKLPPHLPPLKAHRLTAYVHKY